MPCDAARKENHQGAVVGITRPPVGIRTIMRPYDPGLRQIDCDIRKVVVHDGHQWTEGKSNVRAPSFFLRPGSRSQTHGAEALSDFRLLRPRLMTWLIDGAAPQLSVNPATYSQMKPDHLPRVDDEARFHPELIPKAVAILQPSMELALSTGRIWKSTASRYVDHRGAITDCPVPA